MLCKVMWIIIYIVTYVGLNISSIYSYYAYDYLTYLLFLTLPLPVTRICVNFSTVYSDMLVAKGLNINYDQMIILKLVN